MHKAGFAAQGKVPNPIMPNAYTISQIAREEIAAAYLLVEAAKTGIESDAWNEFCERIIEWRGAIGLYDEVILAKNGTGHIKGLFVTQSLQSLLLGRTMDVPLFVCASASDEDGVMRQMIDALKERARAANCRRIRVWTPGSESWNRIADELEFGSDFHGRQIEVANYSAARHT